MTDYAVTIPDGPSALLPVVASKTIRARDGNVGEKLKLDVTGWGINQIRELLVAITGNEMQAQINIQNPPAFAEVDGMRGRGIANAQKKVTVSFGMRLKVQALNELKRALMAAIGHSTRRDSGRLSNPANWEFRYVRNGRATALPLSGASGIPMGQNDFITLMPKGVVNGEGTAYATAVNKRVTGSGKLSFRRTAKGKVRKHDQGIGFLALAARAAGASQLFSGFNVLSGFTEKYALPGEVVNRRGPVSHGPFRTGYIKISPKTGKR